jgi:putative endonuclease
VLSSFAVKDEYRYWVYIVASKTGTLYTGMTGDLYTRIMQHKAGEIEGFSKTYGCNRLVHYAGCNEVIVMINREKQIKSWRRKKKIDLIEKACPRFSSPSSRKDESAPIAVIALHHLCRLSWESEELDERLHALFLTAARKSLRSCELGDTVKARPKQFR